MASWGLGGGGMEEEDISHYEEMFMVTCCCLNWDDGFIGAYIRQNIKLHTLNLCSLSSIILP